MFFRKKKEIDLETKTYELFLDNIDNLSQIRLRGIDLSFALFESKLKSEGLTLTEVSCIGSTVMIRRNQNGYYVDETKALNSHEEFIFYQYGLSILKKYKMDFERIHNLLKEKEIIMNGYFVQKKLSHEELCDMALSLGYGKKRKEEIYEEDPIHPSSEFKNLVNLLDEVKKRDSDNDKIIAEVLDIIRPYFKDNYKIMEKSVEDKYDLSFDDSFGVLVCNKDNGDMHLIYEVDGFDIKRRDYSQYLKKECVYLDIYFRIICKCLKKKFEKKVKK